MILAQILQMPCNPWSYTPLSHSTDILRADRSLRALGRPMLGENVYISFSVEFVGGDNIPHDVLSVFRDQIRVRQPSEARPHLKMALTVRGGAATAISGQPYRFRTGQILLLYHPRTFTTLCAALAKVSGVNSTALIDFLPEATSPVQEVQIDEIVELLRALTGTCARKRVYILNLSLIQRQRLSTLSIPHHHSGLQAVRYFEHNFVNWHKDIWQETKEAEADWNLCIHKVLICEQIIAMGQGVLAGFGPGSGPLRNIVRDRMAFVYMSHAKTILAYLSTSNSLSDSMIPQASLSHLARAIHLCDQALSFASIQTSQQAHYTRCQARLMQLEITMRQRLSGARRLSGRTPVPYCPTMARTNAETAIVKEAAMDAYYSYRHNPSSNKARTQVRYLKQLYNFGPFPPFPWGVLTLDAPGH